MSGMVVSPHPLATEAGRAVLAEGGSAIEAAVAINAVLTVVYPHFCGLGGDAVWLLADGKEPPKCLLGIGQGVSAEIGPSIPTRGPGSVLTTAAVVDSWGEALALGPTLFDLAKLLAPAIALAEDGYPISGSQAHWLDFRATETADWPGFDQYFRPGGVTLQPGDTFQQPQLAETLRSIATNGPRDFYEGGLARKIVEGLTSIGASIALNDLASTRTRHTDPISLDYRGVTVLAPPPPTQGLTTLQIMGVLAKFDLSAMEENGVEHLHHVVEAVKQAFLDRGHIADPNHAEIDVAALLHPSRLAQKAASVGHEAMAWPPVFQPADTVHFAAVDGQGRCASVLQSIYFDWGSGVVAGDTGIVWQNRGAAFSADKQKPNGFAPGKLPFYTLNPGMVGGRPKWLYGTQGADGQPQTLAMLLTRLIDYGRSPAEALAAGRFLLGRTFSDSNDTLKLEEHLGNETIAGLTARGHETALIPELSPLAGQAGIIAIAEDGALDGAHDPRGEGNALASP
jgi:gamma-glutamyltranspeptidase